MFRKGKNFAAIAQLVLVFIPRKIPQKLCVDIFNRNVSRIGGSFMG